MREEIDVAGSYRSSVFTSSDNKNAAKRDHIRNILRKFFPNRDCFTLVRPVEEETDLQKLETLDYNELRHEFLQGVNQLRYKILSSMGPKVVNGVQITGEALASLCLSYVNSINSGDVPTINSVWTYIWQFEWDKFIESIVDQYSQKLSNFWNPKESLGNLFIQKLKWFDLTKKYYQNNFYTNYDFLPNHKIHFWHI